MPRRASRSPPTSAPGPDDLVLVPNTTSGLTVAARSLRLEPGDEVLTSDEEYGAAELMWMHLGVELVRQPVEDVCRTVEAHARPLPQPRHLADRARAACRRALPVGAELGLVSIVDGAHAPGQLPLDIEALGADVYVGNCHKWLCAPKGSAFLWVRPEVQPRIESLAVGWGYDEGSTFLTRNERLRTRDPAAYLAVPAAIRWLEEHGEPERCRGLAAEAAQRIRALTGLPAVEPFAQMVACELSACDPEELQRRLLERHSIEVFVKARGKRILLRASFQVYNDADDIGFLVDALAAELVGSPVARTG